MNMNVEILLISSYSCNDLKSLNLNKYRYLKSIEIGDDCFSDVKLFDINGLNELKSLKIGNRSFTQQKSNWDTINMNSSRSFRIVNCGELESIEIGSRSFSDYGGGFKLKNLPKLSTIKIGEIGSDSCNFFYSSFVVRGIINVILILNRSSTFEFY